MRDYFVEIGRAPPEEGGYLIATVPDLPGCTSDADDWDSVEANVADAIDTWIAAARRLGRPVPPPATISEKRA
ncbi:putative RNase H-like HicB family nuclease [Methylobacterium sp. BE186]|nr:putative RNase H-like HicB family nuclease [Methylobacterium sp. BE186]